MQLKFALPKRAVARWASVLALAATAFLAAQVVLAVHDVGVIELDGNYANDGAAGTDWGALFNASGGNSGNSIPGTELARRFVKDFAVNSRGQIAVDTSYFQPSTKDYQEINAAGASDVWACTTGNVADKDDIINGYAVLVDATDVGGGIDRIAYVGMERFDNSGNAFFGVWLFQSTVGCTPDGKFTGEKKVGDVLALIDFENGGTDPANTHITAYQWVGSGGDVPGAEQFDLLSAGAGCAIATASDNLCAVVNTVTLDPVWDFQGKGGANVLPNQFVEAGFNLSDLFSTSASALPCFSTILIETRSSSSIDATLKDYLSSNFQSCIPTMTTQVSTAGPVLTGITAVTDTATITVLGSSSAPDPTSPANVDFFLCGPLAAGATGCATGGTSIGSSALIGGTPNDGTATAVSPAVNTAASPLAPGRYCFRAEWGGDATYTFPSGQKLVHTNNTTECFEVVSPTTTTTRQFVFPNDKAQIAASAGGNLAGSVQFRLYSSLATCQANGGTAGTGMLYEQSIAISGASPQSATTTNTSVRVATDTTVYWRVAYTSTNPLQQNSLSNCVESTLVDFSGDNGAISIP